MASQQNNPSAASSMKPIENVENEAHDTLGTCPGCAAGAIRYWRRNTATHGYRCARGSHYTTPEALVAGNYIYYKKLDTTIGGVVYEIEELELIPDDGIWWFGPIPADPSLAARNQPLFARREPRIAQLFPAGAPNSDPRLRVINWKLLKSEWGSGTPTPWELGLFGGPDGLLTYEEANVFFPKGRECPPGSRLSYLYREIHELGPCWGTNGRVPGFGPHDGIRRDGKMFGKVSLRRRY